MLVPNLLGGDASTRMWWLPAETETTHRLSFKGSLPTAASTGNEKKKNAHGKTIAERTLPNLSWRTSPPNAAAAIGTRHEIDI